MTDLPDELIERLDRYAAMHGMDQKQAIEHLLRGALHLAIPEPTEIKQDTPSASQKKAAPSSTANLLARRNGSKLNQLVQQRHNPDAWSEDGGAETDVDLLVDRLHDLAESPDQGQSMPTDQT